MEALVSRHEGTAIVKDVRAEIDKLLRQLYGEPGAAEGGAKGGSGGGGGKPRPRVRGADRKGARQEVRFQSHLARSTGRSVHCCCCVAHPLTSSRVRWHDCVIASTITIVVQP